MKEITCPKCQKSYQVPDNCNRLYCSCGSHKQSDSAPTQKLQIRRPCVHLGAAIEELPCGCAGKPKVMQCGIHGTCLVKKITHESAKPHKCCQECTDWA